MKNTPFIHLLDTPLNNYVFDVNTNQFAAVDRETYDYLNKLLKAEDDEELSVPESVERQLQKLKEKGLLSDNRPKTLEHPFTDVLEAKLDSSLEQITLQVTQQCNFRCSYCAYVPQDFELNRQHSSKKMSYETAKKAIDFFQKHSRDNHAVAIGFYGGEPLLAMNLIKRILPYCEEVLEGKKISYTMTTNGSLLTLDNAEFLRKYNVPLVISLDGPPEIHNHSRKFLATGKGTYETIEKNLWAIKRTYPDYFKMISFNIVVDPRYSMEGIHKTFFESELFKGASIRVTLVDDLYSVEKSVPTDVYWIGTETRDFKTYMAELGRYGKAKLSEIDINRMKLRRGNAAVDFKSYIPLREKEAPGGPCIPGQKRLFVDVGGRFFPCEKIDETSEAMCVGDVERGFDYERAHDLLNICKLTPEECRNCWAFRHCTCCVVLCDENGLSPRFKLSHCQGIRQTAEEKFMNHLLFKELER